MSNFKRANEQVKSTWKMLQQQWIFTKEQWNDAASKTFEKDILQEFEPAVREIADQLSQLDHLVAQAKRGIK
jgi:uncharacterized protein YukE